MTVDEVAAVLRVTVQFVDSHASAGDLPSVSVDKTVRIRRSVVRHVIDGSPVLGQPRASGGGRSRRLVALRVGDSPAREVERRPVRLACASCFASQLVPANTVVDGVGIGVWWAELRMHSCATCFVHTCWEHAGVGVMQTAASEADLWCGCHCSRPRCVRRPRIE